MTQRHAALGMSSKETAQMRRDATRDARRIVSSRSGEIRRYAHSLDEKGRL